MPTTRKPLWAVVLVMLLALLAAFISSQARAESTAALVVQDAVALRGAAREAAPVQAQLWRGEAVEIRGERPDHWQVWDYRRERGGYVRKSALMRLPGGEGATAALLAQLRLAQLQSGAEGLGLGLAAAYVQAATPAELAGPAGSEVLETMGLLAERIADRASTSTANISKSAEAQLAAQLDVAARYGLRFDNLQADDGRTQVCYEGEALRRVLAQAANAEQRALAALALTRPECHDKPRDAWRAEVLSKVDATALPVYLKNRLLMRRAAVAASLAFAQGRRGDAPEKAERLAQSALADFAAIAPSDLSEDDQPAYTDTAMRVNAARWLARPASMTRLRDYALTLVPGEPGQTCVLLSDTRKPDAVLARRCSWGLIAPASATLNREGHALTLAVQPLDGWRELWLFTRATDGAWQVQVLPPAAAQPGLGYAEFAGWVPGGAQLLVAREARAEGRYRRSYEVVNITTLATERQAGDAQVLGAFQRWADAGWTSGSLSRR